ncbi:hypothetical protein [Amnibacterium setariae]|uniref:DUF4190 domain-containing protein n=1 Tax=Amnibacterium setariae TaxID=2306585 RepID=A0A3A1TVY8_9MICO|nr:hypothetical protein [Amnibacterium setariae]RIX28423.1 hypothetical protein D1781_13400 [Amnibacterium setariae]
MSYAPGPASNVGSSQVIYQQVVRAPSNGIATAALVLGIVAIVLGVWMVIPFVGLFFAFISFVPAVLGVVFGVLGLRQASRIAVGRGAAITGLVTGGLTLAIGASVTLFWIFALAASAASQSSGA